MQDLIVNLYSLEEKIDISKNLNTKCIFIKRVLSPDRYHVINFVKENFNAGWAGETEYALSNSPVSCFIAVLEKNIVGFACYDATAKGYFGPTGVLKEQRGNGIGIALLHRCLMAMREDGYGYAIIGSVEQHTELFYAKSVGAVAIGDASTSVYKRLISSDH